MTEKEILFLRKVLTLYLPETMRLERALHRLRQTGERLAVVQDRTRRDVGIITLESILGRLFGDVRL